MQLIELGKFINDFLYVGAHCMRPYCIYYKEVSIEMGEKGLDFKHKEVINITDAKRLGYVQDVTADLETGRITSIIVPGSNKLMSLFASGNDIIIPWEKIKSIGEDLILVEI